jgi:hypothetical protein
MLFWTLTVFSLLIDAIWAYQWQDIYGLLIYDEGKNLINSSRTEVFFHSFILVNSILVFILKVVSSNQFIFLLLSGFGDPDTRTGLKGETIRKNFGGFFRLGQAQ